MEKMASICIGRIGKYRCRRGRDKPVYEQAPAKLQDQPFSNEDFNICSTAEMKITWSCQANR
jgi:hypothetical protein